MNGSIASLREVNAKVNLMYLLNEVEGETTAGKITMGARQSNGVATAIATAFIGRLVPERKLLTLTGVLRGDFLRLAIAARYMATWKTMMGIMKTARKSCTAVCP